MKILALTPDAPLLLQLLATEIEGGLELVVEPSLRSGLKRLHESAWSLVLVDSILDDEIIHVVERIATTGQRVVLLARSVSVELTLDALRRGVWDMLPFPIDATELRDVIGRSNAADAATGAIGRRSGAFRGATAFDRSVPVEWSSGNAVLVGESPKLVAAVKTAERAADSTAPMLVQGERGTGKELLARFLHDRSRRREGPFVAVDCAAMPEHVLESDLFGHERGAFAGAVTRRVGRFEQASGGTLFLDEVGDMSLPVQAKILRAVQERELERLGGEKPVAVDVRLVAATTRSLEDEVVAGRFREDLYYLLALVVVLLPPLRERGDDIRLLADHCIAKGAREHGWRVKTIAKETLELLRAYPWPGNVRQLCNVMERALAMADGPALLPAHLPPEIRDHPTQAYFHGTERRLGRERRERHDRRSGGMPLPPLEALERDHIRRALALTGGQIGRAAELLGIHRNTLRRKLRDWGFGGELDPANGEEGTIRPDVPPS
jgi:two-component system, NtrC family, response regulator AtoC